MPTFSQSLVRKIVFIFSILSDCLPHIPAAYSLILQYMA